MLGNNLDAKHAVSLFNMEPLMRDPVHKMLAFLSAKDKIIFLEGYYEGPDSIKGNLSSNLKMSCQF